MRRIAACLTLLCAAACSGGTSSPKPLTRVPPGQWSDATATLQAANNGAELRMVCEADTVKQTLDVDANGNFTWTGVAHVGTNTPLSPAHTASFVGHATLSEIVITRNVTDDATISPVTHTLTPGAPDFSPCPAKVGN
jgi:hypothetical protein